MKGRFLAWFLFILCTQSTISLGFEGFSTLKFGDFNVSKPRTREQLHAVKYAGINAKPGLDAKNDGEGSTHEIFHSMKGQKGKGTYGGGNAAHHPRSNKAADSASHCSLISKAMFHASLSLIAFSLPYFLTGF